MKETCVIFSLHLCYLVRVHFFFFMAKYFFPISSVLCDRSHTFQWSTVYQHRYVLNVIRRLSKLLSILNENSCHSVTDLWGMVLLAKRPLNCDFEYDESVRYTCKFAFNYTSRWRGGAGRNVYIGGPWLCCCHLMRCFFLLFGFQTSLQNSSCAEIYVCYSRCDLLLAGNCKHIL